LTKKHIAIDHTSAPQSKTISHHVTSKNWARGNLDQYYNLTGALLQPILTIVFDYMDIVDFSSKLVVPVDNITTIDNTLMIEKCYRATIRALKTASDACIPSHKEPFTKFWWD